jgi:hypothetical protein
MSVCLIYRIIWRWWWSLTVGSLTFIGWTFQVALSQNHIWEQEPEDVHFVWPSCWAGRRAAADNMPHTKLSWPVLFELLHGTHENMSHLCEAYRVWRLVWWKSRKVRQYIDYSAEYCYRTVRVCRRHYFLHEGISVSPNWHVAWFRKHVK